MTKFRTHAKVYVSGAGAPDPDEVTIACQRIQAAAGCSAERAFDLLYGAAVSQGGGLYVLAGIIAHARDVRMYLEALEKYRDVNLL